MHRKTIVTAAAVALATILVNAPAHAMSNRTFVSPTGNDLNPCSLAAPCRNLQAALAQTNPGGEISILGTAGYGGNAPFIIDRAVSIVNEGGYEAGIAVQSGMAGIVINAGTTDAVSLRGLTVDGNGVGTTGIQFNSGQSLTIKNCVVRHIAGNGSSGAGDGIKFIPTASSNLFVSDTVASDNGGYGLYVFPSGSGTVSAVFNHVETNNNAYGIILVGTSSTGTVKGTVTDSVASGNTDTGFYVQGGSSVSAALTVFHSVAANNGVGLTTILSPATLRVANSVVTGNTFSWNAQSSGILRSYGDNYIDGNGDGDPAPTTIARK